MPADMIYAPQDPAAEVLDGSFNQWEIDTAGWYCPDGVCPPQIGNVYIYRDQNHISNAYAESLAPLLWDTLFPIFAELSLTDAPPATP